MDATQAVLEIVAEQFSGKTTTKAYDLKAAAARVNPKRPYQTVVAAFRAFEKKGWGRFVVGRRGRDTRFEWRTSPATLVAQANEANGANPPQPVLQAETSESAVSATIANATTTSEGETAATHVTADESDDPVDEAPQSNAGMREMVVHCFPLRRGLTIQVTLPDDLTPVEASRLATFLQTLPC